MWFPRKYYDEIIKIIDWKQKVYRNHKILKIKSTLFNVNTNQKTTLRTVLIFRLIAWFACE